MTYAVVAFPKLDARDIRNIAVFRAQYDVVNHTRIEPHFTLVFPTDLLSYADLVTEIRQRASDVAAFWFALRCATVHKDAFASDYHVFLVPDEGNSRFVKLHDLFYGERLLPALRTDIDYIPHLTVATLPDGRRCRELAQEWNIDEMEIAGRIDEIAIVRLDGSAVERMVTIRLYE